MKKLDEKELKHAQFLGDLVTMIGYMLKVKKDTPSNILFNVAHDVSGYCKEDKFFLPRCTGYMKKVKLDIRMKEVKR